MMETSMSVPEESASCFCWMAVAAFMDYSLSRVLFFRPSNRHNNVLVSHIHLAFTLSLLSSSITDRLAFG
jgi:hypothetical protein